MNPVNSATLPVYYLKGALDSFTSRDFKKSTDQMPLERGYIILELSDLKYITSSGIAAFVELARRLEKRGGLLCLLHPNEEVRMLLEFFGMTGPVRIAHSWKEAEALFKKVLGIDRPGFQITEGGPVHLDRDSGRIPKRKEYEPQPVSETVSPEANRHPEPVVNVDEPVKPPIVENEKINHLNSRLTSLSENLNRLNATLENLASRELAPKEPPPGNTVEFPASVESEDVETFSSPEPEQKSEKKETVNKEAEKEEDSGEKAVNAPSKPEPAEPQNETKQPAPEPAVEENFSSADELHEVQSHPVKSATAREMRESRILRCEQCHSHLRIYQTGRHLCPSCDIEFEVRSDGSASFYEAVLG